MVSSSCPPGAVVSAAEAPPPQDSRIQARPVAAWVRSRLLTPEVVASDRERSPMARSISPSYEEVAMPVMARRAEAP